MCKHRWTYRGGRSWCPDCDAWALDLRCCPSLRLQGGRYPTTTDLQNYFVCSICNGNLRTRVVQGDLRVLCDECGGDAVETGKVTPKRKRDYVFARQEADALEVLDGLPPELRGLVS